MEKQVDMNRIKDYNNELRQMKNKLQQEESELRFMSEQLEGLCADLSEEMKIAITPENIDIIAKQVIQNIENTLNTGEAVLSEIKQN